MNLSLIFKIFLPGRCRLAERKQGGIVPLCYVANSISEIWRTKNRGRNSGRIRSPVHVYEYSSGSGAARDPEGGRYDAGLRCPRQDVGLIVESDESA